MVPLTTRIVLILGLLGALAPRGLLAETFTVTQLHDDDGACTATDCTLREAVLAANGLPGEDSIHVPAGTYQLTIPGVFPFEGDLMIRDDLQLIALSGPAVIVGTGTQRVLTVFRADARIVGFTITGGHSGIGAGLFVGEAEVSLEHCVVTDNHASSDGGGVILGPVARLEVIETTVSNNSAERRGGGIRRSSITTSPANLVIRNSTISGNTAPEGSAISSFGGGGDFRIENTTIVDNPFTGRRGTILILAGNSPTFVNSIIESRCFFVLAGIPVSLGGNVEGPGDTCGLRHPTDLLNVADFGLLPLGDYGGPTPTHELTEGSPAIDHALPGECPANDQRGFPRPIDGDHDAVPDCDSGAVELQPPATVAVPVLSPGSLVVLAMALVLLALGRLRSDGQARPGVSRLRI